MIKKTWYLENVQEIAKQNPDTFYAPSHTSINRLSVGALVKLMFINNARQDTDKWEAERMWVEITQINGSSFIGKLDNEPYEIKNLHVGDDIHFKDYHIMNIYDDTTHQFNRLFNLYTIHAPRDFQPITNSPICFEIGAGKGKHALLFAHNNPSKHLIAIERTMGKASTFNNVDCPSNLSLIHADAIAWSVYGIYPKQISECFILYPNPEPKNKNQRFINMPYFEFLLSRIMDNGTITIASNIQNYIEECELRLQDTWKLPYTKHIVPNHSNRTHFEIKYLARGELCQELIITKPIHYKTRFDDMMPKHLWDNHNGS